MSSSRTNFFIPAYYQFFELVVLEEEPSASKVKRLAEPTVELASALAPQQQMHSLANANNPPFFQTRKTSKPRLDRCQEKPGKIYLIRSIPYAWFFI